MDPISICVCLKNRSRLQVGDRELTIFPNAVERFASAHLDSGPLELVVADFNSDDWPLSEWLTSVAGGMNVRIVPVDAPFSRGLGSNVAVQHATHDHLFLCDADMITPPGLFGRARQLLRQGDAFFPICEYIEQDGRSAGPLYGGFGNAFVTRQMFDDAGGVPAFMSWGGEDDIFFERVARVATIVRETFDGFQHQWHPPDTIHRYDQHPARSDYWHFRNRGDR